MIFGLLSPEKIWHQ